MPTDTPTLTGLGALTAAAAKATGNPPDETGKVLTEMAKNLGFSPARAVLRLLGADPDKVFACHTRTRGVTLMAEAVAETSGKPVQALLDAMDRGVNLGLGPARSLLHTGGIDAADARAVVDASSDVIAARADMIDRALVEEIGASECYRLRIVPLEHSDGSVHMLWDGGGGAVRADAERLVADLFDAETRWSLTSQPELEGCLMSLRASGAAAADGERPDRMGVNNWQTLAHSDGGAGGVDELIVNLMSQAAALGASDIHLSTVVDSDDRPRVQARLRIAGRLREHAVWSETTGKRIINRFRLAGEFSADLTRPVDGRFDVRVPRFGLFDLRLHASPKPSDGQMMVIRLLKQGQSGLENIRRLFPPEHSSYAERLAALVRQPHGVLIVAGKTGSGKSTTLAALLKDVCADPSRKVITIEDPVELRIPGADQVQVTTQMPFPRALRGFMRADPDVIMVGELRDAETTVTAFHAAQTGHLVLSTAHANDAASVPKRLIDMGGLSPVTVAETLSAVFAQTLVRTLCGRCSAGRGSRAGKPRGCGACDETGWLGRMAVAELMHVTEPVAEAIEDGASPRKIRKTADYTTFGDYAERLIRAGVTTRAETDAYHRRYKAEPRQEAAV